MMNRLENNFNEKNSIYRLMGARLGIIPRPIDGSKVDLDGIDEMKLELEARGGTPQQLRMIKDKRTALDRAVRYSYQGAFIKKVSSSGKELENIERPVRALINPNKLKQDYDDKIVSVRFEHDFHSGDIFEWCNTNSYWLIYLQDLTELAYFRGDIRRCIYEIDWLDNGEEKSTMAAVRGPVETKINFIQKHKISVDEPNYSLHLLLPKNEDTIKAFKRYSKFYLKDDPEMVCWRVEATDYISTPGILEINAVEYYQNTTEDDIENGLVDGFKVKPIDPNPDEEPIIGETFIKPKKTYEYSVAADLGLDWYVLENRAPVQVSAESNKVIIKWDSSYSGQFTLCYGDKNVKETPTYQKIIVVESLF